MTEKKDNTKEPSPAEPDDTTEPEALAKLEMALTHFAQTFESSAKRWEWMVYPAIVIFGIMGISGFWLIYSLTSDVHELARNVDPKMERNLARMSENISSLSENVGVMTDEVSEMKGHISHLDSSIMLMQKDMSIISTKLDTLSPLLFNIAEMNQAMKAMTANTAYMSRDMGMMNQNVGRPMSFMNEFAPW
ncbi:MAG: hypothetical protein ABF290_06750 [Thiogranum sp.]